MHLTVHCVVLQWPCWCWWGVWHRPPPDQHQHGECADVHACTYFPLLLCLFKEAGEGRTMSSGWGQVGRGGVLVCRLAPPPRAVRLRSFDLEWPLCVYIFPNCSLSSSCLCLSWPAVVLAPPLSFLFSLQFSTCLAWLEMELTVPLNDWYWDRLLLCFLLPPFLHQ